MGRERGADTWAPLAARFLAAFFLIMFSSTGIAFHFSHIFHTFFSHLPQFGCCDSQSFPFGLLDPLVLPSHILLSLTCFVLPYRV